MRRALLIVILMTPTVGVSGLWSWIEPLRDRCSCMLELFDRSLAPGDFGVSEQVEMKERKMLFEQLPTELQKEQFALVHARVLIDELYILGRAVDHELVHLTDLSLLRGELIFYMTYLFAQRDRLLQQPTPPPDRLEAIGSVFDAYFRKTS